MPRLELTHIVLHHTAAEEKNTEQIRNYHIKKGWQDIGYDYVIEKDGKVVEGRSLSMQGAHAGVAYYNQHAIGVAVIGNLSKRDIYPAQFASLLQLLETLMNKYRIPIKNILLHREIKNTECPGTRFSKEAVITALESKFSAPAGTEKPLDLAKEIEILLGSLQEEREKNQILQESIKQLEKALKDIQDIILNNIRRDG